MSFPRRWESSLDFKKLFLFKCLIRSNMDSRLRGNDVTCVSSILRKYCAKAFACLKQNGVSSSMTRVSHYLFEVPTYKNACLKKHLKVFSDRHSLFSAEFIVKLTGCCILSDIESVRGSCGCRIAISGIRLRRYYRRGQRRNDSYCFCCVSNRVAR